MPGKFSSNNAGFYWFGILSNQHSPCDIVERFGLAAIYSSKHIKKLV